MVIVGCGYVGQRLASKKLAAGSAILAVAKTAETRLKLEALGLGLLPVDLDDAPPAPQAAFSQADIFYLAPPPAAGLSDSRMSRFLAMLDPERPPRRVVLVSTTAVYGSSDGKWIDESEPAQPGSDRGLRRLDAENQLRNWCDKHGCEWVVLRVAGIYGPGRLPLERLRQAMPMVTEENAPWTNRIHVDDLVTTLSAAMRNDCAGQIFNVSDGEPGNMRQYFDQIADQAGLSRAPEISMAEAREQLSAGMLSYLSESRRIDSRKMREQLGVELQYPDLTSGLAQALTGS